VILERCGYRVLTTENGRIAKRVLLDETSIDLVLADLEMQEISGQELALWCNANRPDVQVVLMSDASGGPVAPGAWTVEMPFIHIDVLIKTVREALNSSGLPRMLECAA
jgi:DNA-binding NtrC family response regulator